MNDININDIISIAKEAGSAILEVYNTDFDYENKKSESFDEGVSPLTKADIAAHNIIEKKLTELYPDIPVLSEESKEISYEVRSKWNLFWLVDPLDGTKEFIKRNGEFTVNIALIKDGKPILGVVYVPVKETTYYGDENGSFVESNNETLKLPVNEPSEDVIKVVASKSHFSNETKEYVENLGKEYELVSVGSSLKLCLVAEGKADIYPRLGPTMEWDTGAAHAVAKFAGRNVINYETNKELNYNKENLLNPWFIVK